METDISSSEFELIKSDSGQRKLRRFKREYIEKAVEVNYTQKEMGENINVSDAAMRDVIKRKAIKGL